MSDTHSLYVIRHAIAAARGPEYPNESKRPLTQRGASRFRKVARGLMELDADVSLILSSPLARARQTADILSQELRGHPPVVETTSLAPGAAYADLVRELGQHTKMEAIAMVGHEPSIGEIAARLVGATGAFEFKKGGVCRIDVDRLPPSGPGRLIWLAPPKLLAGLGR